MLTPEKYTDSIRQFDGLGDGAITYIQGVAGLLQSRQALSPPEKRGRAQVAETKFAIHIVGAAAVL